VRKNKGQSSGIIAAAAIILTVLGVNAVVAYRAILTVSRNDGWVAHTQEVRAGISELRSTLLDMQRSVRGFVIARDEAFLKPYLAGSKESPGQLQKLVELTKDNPRQQERLHELSSLMTELHRYAERGIVLASASHDSGEMVARVGRSDLLLSGISRKLDEMEAEEQALLEQRAEQSRASIRDGLVAFSIASGTGMLLLCATGFVGLRSMQQQLRDADTIHGLVNELQKRADQLEATVAERTSELRESNEALSAFSYSVSHDLRAPLRGVMGLSQALSSDYGDHLDELGRKYLSSVRDSALLMDMLIEDLLAYSQLSRVKLVLQAVDVNAVVTEICAEMQRELSGRVDVERDLPIVLAHRPVLKQALKNLISNASKFVRRGEPASIRVKGETRGEFARISVDDLGIGIPQEHLNRIFEPFERLHGADVYPGTGIGLAIVKRAIERLGGRLGVTSEAGVGSSFWLELRKAR
jgi:signal transduction histidine kinase